MTCSAACSNRSGHLILTLKPSEQSASKADIALLLARLDAIEARLGR